MPDYDVIVIGLGVMGAATLHALSARGNRVLGIERHGVPHGFGSSAGDSRLIRKAYFEHPDYVPLLTRAYHRWRELEAESGQRLLYRTGILYIGQEDAELIAGSRRAAQEHGLELTAVDADQLAARFPRFRLPDGYVACFEPDAGFLACEQALRAFAACALEGGAALRCGERVLDWQADGDGVTVVTDHGRYTAAGLVITAGSWTGTLLAELDLGLRVTRQPLFWLQPEAVADFELGRSSCWAVQRPDRPGLFYGFPALPGELAARLGVKIAHHAPGAGVDPDAARTPAYRREADAVLDAVAPFIQGLDGPLTGSHVCLYTNSRDGHCILDVHPQHRNVAFACGFSGHGFKLAPVIGEALADLATGGRSELPIGFLRLR